MHKKILVVAERGRTSPAVNRWAEFLGRAWDVDLTFLRVLERGSLETARDEGRRLRLEAEGWIRRGLTARSTILYGSPRARVAEFAREHSFDLIVVPVPAPGFRPVDLARETPIPLLFVPAAGELNARRRVSRILVPHDGSRRSSRAVPSAAAFAHALGSEVELLHVAVPPEAAWMPPASAGNSLLRGLDTLRIANAEAGLTVASGNAVREILARSGSTDLVVLATRGRQDGVILSTLLSRATVPVLSILAPDVPRTRGEGSQALRARRRTLKGFAEADRLVARPLLIG